MSITFPGEPADYRTARERLLAQEIELRRASEAVAAARRELPPGGLVPEDYVFEAPGPGSAPVSVRLSELFAPGKDTLLIYSFMYGPDMEHACPGCTHLLDQLDGAAPHVSQQVNIAVVAKSPLPRILAFANERGWRHLRLLSSARNTYNRDYYGETADGQMPMLNVFRRDNGAIHHAWGSELLFAPPEPGQEPRHLDSIDPVWNLLDFTLDGRGHDWQPQLRYD
jgi:predicted dithiol-disulfide oxidoreductase (DUF899 family)